MPLSGGGEQSRWRETPVPACGKAFGRLAAGCRVALFLGADGLLSFSFLLLCLFPDGLCRASVPLTSFSMCSWETAPTAPWPHFLAHWTQLDVPCRSQACKTSRRPATPGPHLGRARASPRAWAASPVTSVRFRVLYPLYGQPGHRAQPCLGRPVSAWCGQRLGFLPASDGSQAPAAASVSHPHGLTPAQGARAFLPPCDWGSETEPSPRHTIRSQLRGLWLLLEASTLRDGVPHAVRCWRRAPPLGQACGCGRLW